jgi:hypothetical protein
MPRTGGIVRLFDSAKMYVFLFCVLVLITTEKLYQLTQSAVPPDTAGFDVTKILVALVTVVTAVYLTTLLGKISNGIERTGIVLTVVLCVLWLANLLTRLGVPWAEISHGRLLSTAIHCLITALAGVRTFQVMFHRSPTVET